MKNDFWNILNNIKLKQMKSKIGFENIKSNVMLKKILNIIEKNKSLEIIKNNKKIQKRVNLTINDYEECCKLYSFIEIELKFVFDKYDKFINISDKDKKYCHIYFDNSKEEIKRNYLDENETVNIIKIKMGYHIN